LDFLDISGQDLQSEDELFSYINEEVDLEDGVDDNVSIIGSINDYRDKESFVSSFSSHFEVIQQYEEDIYLLASSVGEEYIPYYVYVKENFPIFITTANITDEMPPTIEKYLQQDTNLGRFWISMERMEDLRKSLVSRHSDLIIPFFSGYRSRYSEQPAQKRPEYKRRMTYWADDGLETYKELKRNYGILPTNIQFERGNHFKFRMKQEGIFTHRGGSLKEAWKLFKRELKRKRRIKRHIDKGGPEELQSSLYDEKEISVSRPWAVNLKKKITDEELETFKDRLQEDRWEFGVAEYNPRYEKSQFSAELVDDTNHGLTRLRTHEDNIRVFQKSGSDIDQQIRIYNFIEDHIDPECEAVAVS
jgi:hypothetical protein